MEFEKNDRLEDEIAAVRTQCTMLQDEGRVQMIFSILTSKHDPRTLSNDPGPRYRVVCGAGHQLQF